MEDSNLGCADIVRMHTENNTMLYGWIFQTVELATGQFANNATRGLVNSQTGRFVD